MIWHVIALPFWLAGALAFAIAISGVVLCLPDDKTAEDVKLTLLGGLTFLFIGSTLLAAAAKVSGL